MPKTKEVWDKTKACARGKETSPSHFAPYLVGAQGGGVHSGTAQTSSALGHSADFIWRGRGGTRGASQLGPTRMGPTDAAFCSPSSVIFFAISCKSGTTRLMGFTLFLTCTAPTPDSDRLARARNRNADRPIMIALYPLTTASFVQTRNLSLK